MTTQPESAAVIGGGIVGLAVARELSRRHDGLAVTVFEKEERVATHQSGHNSGVVHAGVYYRPGSLKAQLCRRGAGMLREFCTEHGVIYRELGKLIVASSDDELPGLAEIERRSAANLVPDVTRLGPADMADVEPYVRGVAALYSPHTAAVDYVGVCAAMVRDIKARGGTVLTNTEVTGVVESADAVEVWTGRTRRSFDTVVACAGLQSDRVARMAGQSGDLRIVPFRGEYYALAAKASERVRGMIYPVPDARYPFLGVHLTRDVHDGVHVGPNAVLALAYEGYLRRTISPADLRRILTWPGMWRLAARHWRAGLLELASSLSTRRYAALVRRYVAEIEVDDLVPASAGVRAQALTRRGDLVDDFVLQRSGRVLLVRNAPSPAATSSLAIAEHIVTAAALS
jgi:L-2-hydroxyglutarate oxidase LhgO